MEINRQANAKSRSRGDPPSRSGLTPMDRHVAPDTLTPPVRDAGRGTTPDEIYERIVSAIFEHRLAPGTKLGEDRLAAIFGVSRSRIRPALARLAHEKLVRLEPNRWAC